MLTGNINIKQIINKKNVLIYGAGEADRQLVTSLENSPEFKVIGFRVTQHSIAQASCFRILFSQSHLEKLIQTKNVVFIFTWQCQQLEEVKNQII